MLLHLSLCELFADLYQYARIHECNVLVSCQLPDHQYIAADFMTGN